MGFLASVRLRQPRSVAPAPAPPAPAVPAEPPPPRRSPLDLVWDEVTAHEWPGDRPVRAFFDLLLRAIGPKKDGTVLVAADAQAEVWKRTLKSAFPQLTVLVTRNADDESVEHARLSARAPFDVVIQAADVDGTTQARTFRRIFWHLRAGRIYLSPRMTPIDPAVVEPARLPETPLPNEDGVVEPAYVGNVWQLVAEAQAARLDNFHDETDGSVPFRDVRALGRNLAEIRVVSKMLWLRMQSRAQAKLTEAEARIVLAARPEYGREIDQRPAATLHAAAPYTHNLAGDRYFSPLMTAPPMTLRRYERPICSRGQIVTTGNVIWPDTFRHHLYPRLTNIYVEESAPRFGYVRRDISAAEDLPGVWFHLDSEWPGHFGI